MTVRRVTRSTRIVLTLAAVAVFGLSACDGSSGAGAATGPSAVEVGATAPPSTAAPTTSASSATTSAPTTSTSTPAVSSTLPATSTTVEGRPADYLGREIIGTSAGGRPIEVSHRGTPGGTVVLVVGVIHGDEDAGLAITDRLAEMPLPAGIDLWLMPMLNPDGQAAQIRGNANGVDLNRNFPHDWTPIAKPGEWQYSGSGPASEPETKAYIAFTERIRPALTLFYHQDLFRVSPSNGRDGPLRRRYAELTGLPYETISGPTSIYTGVAATWTRKTLPDAMSFVIELGPTLPPDEVQVHADAVIEISRML